LWNDFFHIQTSASPAGKRKKPLAGRQFPMQTNIADTAVLSNQGRRFCLLRRPLHRVSGMAALGGSRHAM